MCGFASWTNFGEESREGLNGWGPIVRRADDNEQKSEMVGPGIDNSKRRRVEEEMMMARIAIGRMRATSRHRGSVRLLAFAAGLLFLTSIPVGAQDFKTMFAESEVRRSPGPTTTEAEVMAFADTWIEFYRRRKARAA